MYQRGGEERGSWERGVGLLRQYIQTLTYMSVNEHMGGSVCINTLTNTTAAFGWTLRGSKRIQCKLPR